METTYAAIRNELLKDLAAGGFGEMAAAIVDALEIALWPLCASRKAVNRRRVASSSGYQRRAASAGASTSLGRSTRSRRRRTGTSVGASGRGLSEPNGIANNRLARDGHAIERGLTGRAASLRTGVSLSVKPQKSLSRWIVGAVTLGTCRD
jgi:hypothetical protein